MHTRLESFFKVQLRLIIRIYVIKCEKLSSQGREEVQFVEETNVSSDDF